MCASASSSGWWSDARPAWWLREYVDLCPGDARPRTCSRRSCASGFEEEDVFRFELQGPIVVGEVLEFVEEPQSNGKTIRWCQVRVAPDGETAADGGAAVHGIVCGARNFFVGDKVVVTLPGAVLPGPFPIAARKTYGHVSDGMIASARELGLGDEHDGILRLASSASTPAVGTDAIACSASTTSRSTSTSRPTAATRCRSAASPASTRTPPVRPSATRRAAGARQRRPAASRSPSTTRRRSAAASARRSSSPASCATSTRPAARRRG